MSGQSKIINQDEEIYFSFKTFILFHDSHSDIRVI